MNESLKTESTEAMDAMDAMDVPCDQWVPTSDHKRPGAEEHMPEGRVCKNTAMLGVKGMEDPGMAAAMMSEWRRQMANEGKASAGTRSIGEEFAAQIAARESQS